MIFGYYRTVWFGIICGLQSCDIDYYNNIAKCTYFRIFVWVDLVLWYFSQSEDALSITDYGFGSLPKQEHTIW